MALSTSAGAQQRQWFLRQAALATFWLPLDVTEQRF